MLHFSIAVEMRWQRLRHCHAALYLKQQVSTLLEFLPGCRFVRFGPVELKIGIRERLWLRT